MRTTIPSDSLAKLELALYRNAVVVPSRRRPVHTVYGGAQLFSAETTAKLGELSRKALRSYAPAASDLQRIFDIPEDISAAVAALLEKKLSTEAVEDLRIDFEDGYGVRSSDEEDGHAVHTAEETAKALKRGELPAFFGIRIKAFNSETGKRALRTLDLYLTHLLDLAGRRLPSNFVVTLPKVNAPSEVEILTRALDEIERASGLSEGTIGIEIMVETARAFVDDSGTITLARIVEAADGRCIAAHFGAYDYLSELGVASSEQNLGHPACDLARGLMKLSLAGREIDLSDGATNLMPVPPHRGTEISEIHRSENAEAVAAAWRLHYSNVRNGLTNGFYRGWDLHPAQFVARYAAIYAFFLESMPDASRRLRSFIEKGAKANLVGNTFDDAATGQGLLNFFRRAVDCGAISEKDATEATDLSMDDLRSRSFDQIIANLARST